MNRDQIYKLILQISLPIIIIAFFMQIAPFLFSDFLPFIAQYVFLFFSALYIVFVVPYFFRQSNDDMLQSKNLLTILVGTASLVFLAVACVNTLFLLIGSASIQSLLRIIYMSFVNAIFCVVLMLFSIKGAQFLAGKKRRLHKSQ